MFTKKSLLKILTAFAIVIAPVTNAFADADDRAVADDNNNSLYIKGFYNPSYVGKSSLSPVNKNAPSQDLEDKVWSATTYVRTTPPLPPLYIPTYKLGLQGAGAAVGWQFNNIIIEIEGALSTIATKPEGYIPPGDPVKVAHDINKILPADAAPGVLDKSGNYIVYRSTNKYNAPVPYTDTITPIFQHNPKYILGMLNTYYNIQMESLGSIKPYIGFGAGVARLTFKSIDNKSTSYPLALQAKVGAAFEASKQFAPYIGYKLLYIMKKEIILNSDNTHLQWGLDATAFTIPSTVLSLTLHPQYLIHNVEAGIIFKFS